MRRGLVGGRGRGAAARECQRCRSPLELQVELCRRAASRKPHGPSSAWPRRRLPGCSVERPGADGGGAAAGGAAAGRPAKSAAGKAEAGPGSAAGGEDAAVGPAWGRAPRRLLPPRGAGQRRAMAEAAAAPVRAARARAASGPGRPGPSTQRRRPQEGFRAGPGLWVPGLRRAFARSAGAYRIRWSRAWGTAVRVPEADQVPGLGVPGPGSFLGAGPELPSPCSPQRPGGTWEVSDVDSADTEHPLMCPAFPGRRGMAVRICPARQADAALSPVEA